MVKKNDRNIFSYNPDINKNAYMNWRMDSAYPIHNFAVMAKGYMDAALLLADKCLIDNTDKKADELIFPILFNANQSIELYLKAIIWKLNRLEDTGDDFDTGHDLRQLLGRVKSLIREEDRMESWKRLNHVQSYIDELYLLLHPDTNGRPAHKENLDFPRYPLNKKKDPYPYAEAANTNVVIDLENFINRFTEISSNLEVIYDYFEGQLQWQEENC